MAPERPGRAPFPLVVWIAFCAYWNGAGWLLSACHLLNPTGYAVALLAGLGLLAGYICRNHLQGARRPVWQGWRRRFRRALPRAFLILSALAFLGGLLYAPNSYDALAYRIPRLLHWLAASRWHWIHTEFNRLNTRGCGFEWLAAPLLALAKTDRPLFLYNWLSFLFLPGLIFSSARRLGVRPRVAYSWMWVLPGGYCFLLQAGSLGNDVLVTTLVLAAVDLGLRARVSQRLTEFWLSLLAMTLSTGVKANALTLGLLWLVVVAPVARRLVSVRAWSCGPRLFLPPFLMAALVLALALLDSFIPSAFWNWKYGGDWTGVKFENAVGRGIEKAARQKTYPFQRLLGNTAWFLVQNFEPPIFPLANTWNEHVAPRLVPPSVRTAWEEEFVSANYIFELRELQVEEIAGLGLGASALLAISVGAVWLPGRRRKAEPGRPFPWLLAVAAVVPFLALFSVSDVESLSRLAAPCYLPLALVLLIPGGHERVVRSRSWRAGALLGLGLGGVLLVVNPARPLFSPPQAVNFLRRMGCPDSLLRRADRVYGVYAQRAEAFAPAVDLLPPGEQVIGVVTWDDPEASLWKPYGSRRIVHVCLHDTPESLRAAGIHYVWVSGDRLEKLFLVPIGKWLAQFHGQIIHTVSLNLRASSDPVPWHLVRLLEPE